MKNIILYLGSDHAGFKLKEKIKQYLGEKKIKFFDLGPEEYNKKDDYPDFAKAVSEKVSKDSRARGILICGTGQGMSITANKFKGVYSVACYDKNQAKKARQHGNVNVLSLGARIVNEEEAKKIVNSWIRNEFKKGRHLRRLNKIKKIEKENFAK